MSKKYENSPLIETLCEFKFSPDTEWDSTVTGMLYEKILKEFPIKEERSVKEITFDQSDKGLRQSINHTPRTSFFTEDRKSSIQIGPHLLAISRFQPYSSWENYGPKITFAFDSLKTLIDIKGLLRVGLRYINRIEVETTESVDLDNFFNFTPRLGKNLPQDMQTFIVGCVLPFFKGRDACKVQLTDALPSKPSTSAFLLDLDYSLNKPSEIPIDKTMEWIETAHNKIDEIFEGCITDNLRTIFKEIQK